MSWKSGKAEHPSANAGNRSYFPRSAYKRKNVPGMARQSQPGLAAPQAGWMALI